MVLIVYFLPFPDHFRDKAEIMSTRLTLIQNQHTVHIGEGYPFLDPAPLTMAP